MYKDFDELELLEYGRREVWWRRDRNDKYKYCGESRSPSTMGIRIFYKLDEAHCNPDFDW